MTIYVFLFALIFFVNAQIVSICTGDYSYAYHSISNCRGLNNCQGKIIQVDMSTAKNVYKRIPCEICCVQGIYIEGITNNTINNGFVTYKPLSRSSGYFGGDYSVGYLSSLLFCVLPFLEDSEESDWVTTGIVLASIGGAIGLAVYSNGIFFYPAYNFNYKKDNSRLRWMFGFRKIFNRTALELGASYLIENTIRHVIYRGGEYYDEENNKRVGEYYYYPEEDYNQNIWGFHLNYLCYFKPYSSRKRVNMYIGPSVNYINGIGFGGLTGVEFKCTRWLKFDLRYEWTTKTNQIQTGLVFKYQ